MANAFWNERMFLLHGDAKYVDVLERTLYNGVLGGVSLSRGSVFLYQCNGVGWVEDAKRADALVYDAVLSDEYCADFAAGGELRVCDGRSWGRGRGVCEFVYEWECGFERGQGDGEGGAGDELSVGGEGEVDGDAGGGCGRICAARARAGVGTGEAVPGDLYRYADKVELAAPRIAVNGAVIGSPAMEKGYAVIKRAWKAGDVVEMDLPMEVRRVVANAGVEADRGRVAIRARAFGVLCGGGGQRGACAEPGAAGGGGVDREF